MDFHQLRIFATVYRHQSFTKASVVLNMSQPTISEHIKNLESEFSCKLFDRLGRSIAPTQKADVLYPKVQQLLDGLGKLREEFVATSGALSGEITFGASTIPGTYILPQRAGAFRAKHPDVSFEIRINDTARITEMVLQHDLLCGIVGSQRNTHPNLIYQPLVADELVFVAHKSLCSGKGPLRPKDLCALPFIIREKGSGTRDSMVSLLEKAGVDCGQLHVAATLGSSSSVKEATKAGLGASCLSRLAVREELARKELVELKVKGLSLKRDFYLITHRKRTLPSHYQAFCQYLLAEKPC